MLQDKYSIDNDTFLVRKKIINFYYLNKWLKIIIIYDNYKKNYYKKIEIIIKRDEFRDEREILKNLKNNIEYVIEKIELLNKKKF